MNCIEPIYGSGEMPIGFGYPKWAKDIAKENQDKIMQISKSVWQDQSNK